MALPIDQIASLSKEDFYRFDSYISPKSLALIQNALSKCTIVSTTRHKFEYKITDCITPKARGFYVYVIEELGLPIDFRYLLYIGRAIGTNSFKNRFYKYRNSIDSTEVAKNIMQLTNLWPDNTFVYFFEIKDDKQTADVEKILINKLRPPFNEEYFTDKAVATTDLYKLAQQD